MDRNPEFSLSVVVVSFNRKDVLKKHLLVYLNAVVNIPFEIIVVDNASTDGSVELLAGMNREFPSLRVVYESENGGVSKGRNAGYRIATGDVVLSLDEDALSDPSTWVPAMEYFLHVPNLGVLAPRVVSGRTGLDQGVHLSSMSELANFHGAGHFIRRAPLEKVNFLDENCFFGGEEIDLSIRLRDIGFVTLHAPEFIVQHFNIQHSGPVGRQRRLQWTYSYARVFSKNFSARHSLCLLIRRWLSSVRTYDIDSRTLFALKSASVTLRGFADGRRVSSLVGAETSTFYMDKNLEPEFGNRPLHRKVFGTIFRGLGSSSTLRRNR